MAASIKAENAHAALQEAAKIADQYRNAPEPEIPKDCNVRENSGVKVNDLYEVALTKSERALDRSNDRVQRCYRWQIESRAKIKHEN